MKIGIFGGSFDPVHNGHVELSQAFMSTLSLDRVLVIPAYVSPFKIKNRAALPLQRLEMCRLAFSELPNTEVSDIEIVRQGASFTYQTLQTLALQCPDSELFLITGADSFLTLQNWREPKEIFRLATVCVIPRNDDREDVLKKHAEYLHELGAKTEILGAEVMTVSSTEIRRRVQSGESIKGLVPEKVEEYIYENGLYLPQDEIQDTDGCVSDDKE